MKICSKCRINKPPEAWYPSQKSECRACTKARTADYRKNNPEKVKASLHAWWLTHKIEARDAYRQWRLENPEKARAARLRKEQKIPYRIRKNLRNRIWYALAGLAKSAATLELLGCSVPELRAHLEKQFKPDMTWENYGKWQIDHIRPCASFDLTDFVQQKQCFHFSNVQPLWALENQNKGDTWR